MEPCGTPHDTFIHSELVSLIYIDFYFRDSYIPIYLLSIIMIHCVKGLFLFFRSIKTPTVDLQSSIVLVMSSTSTKIAKDVGIFCSKSILAFVF